MELRYLGFDQLQNARTYRFDVIAKGETTREFLVTADLRLFRTHHVGIQEGPNLCARKLAADLETSSAASSHELTADDFQAYVDARAAEETRKADLRQGGRRRPPPPAHSPWRGARP